jgi:alkylation response protein AidB-like acyl-CoA dehydrogenase
LWRSLVELGITGLQIAEEHGGLGLGALDAVVVYEQFGRALAPSPHHISSVLAAALLAAAGSGAQCARWLPALASGGAVASVASLEPGGDYERGGVQLSARRDGDHWLLNGAKHFVPYAAVADVLIVLARCEAAVVALLVDPAAAGVTRRLQSTLAGEPLYALHFDAVRVPAADALHEGGDVWPHWQRAMFAGAIPWAARAVGAAARVHEISVAYAKVREAFGRPIGGFQALAHYLADVLVAVEGARTLVYQAAWARDSGRPCECLAAMAKLQACAVFRYAAAVAVQVHGGLGYTREADPQLFFRRAKQWQSLHWDERCLEEKIADLLRDEAHV